MSYEILMARLGFPDSERLRRILEYLMNEEEAKVAAALPGTAEEVAEKLGMDAERVKEILENLFFKGVVFPKDFQKRDYWRFAKDLVQLHDATLASVHMKDPEYARMWKEFGEMEAHAKMGQLLAMADFKVWRVVPAYGVIKDLPDVLPQENIVEMIKAQEKIAVVPCSCRNVTYLAGDGCRHTDEMSLWHCIQFGRGAEYVITRGSGREITADEAIEIIMKAEEDGLVHTWPNTGKIVDRRVTVNCNCCEDCCEFFLSAKYGNVPIESLLEKSRYLAYVDEDMCIACGVCEERCPFEAITLEDVAKVDEEKCFGCGVCVVGCEQEAIKLKATRPPEHIPP